MSARASPPIANATARSSRILAGSCRANRGRHGANAFDIAVSTPAARAVCKSSTPPADETTFPAPAVTTGSRARPAFRADRRDSRVDFPIEKVLLTLP